MAINELTAEQVRAIGVALNGGRTYGWRERLAVLTGASHYTIRSWCDDESTASHRTCAGPAAKLLLILKDMHRKDIDVAAYLESLALDQGNA